MKMSTNIMLLPAHHPVEIAEQINTINEMSNNRFILGAGIGYKPDEFEHVGWGFKNRASRFEECLQIVRLALTGKEFSYRAGSISRSTSAPSCRRRCTATHRRCGSVP